MIPLVDLQAQYVSIKDEIDTAVLRVLASGKFALGPEVVAFEEAFSSYCGTNHGIAVNSGTSALHLALLAAGVRPGDEVITSPYTFVGSVAAIQYAGGTPVLVDIDPQTYTIDTDQVATVINKRTKAIIPVHLYGHPADMDPLLALAREHGLTVVEDAAQAHGAEYRGSRVGGLGNLGCFSFYPTKNLGACGEGGIIVTNDESHARTIRSLRSWGKNQRHQYTRPGFNYRMDNIQAAILRVKLRHLPEWTKTRRRIAATYDQMLADANVTTPTVRPDSHHVYHIYAIQTPCRDALHRTLDTGGIQTGLHYPVPIHLQPGYANLRGQAGDHPFAEAAAASTLTLPIYPELPTDVPARIAEIIQRSQSN